MGGGDVTSAMEAVSPTDAAGDAVTVNISCSSAFKFSVQINLDSTVLSFKALLARNCEIPADQQRLIYKGRILKDDQTLQSYGLEADHTVHLVRRFAPTPSAATTNAAGSISSGGLNTSQTNSRAVGSDDGGALGAGGAGQRASLFPGLGFGGLGGSADLFGAGLPDFEQVQEQLTRNPDIMTELMNTPAVRNLINDPDMVGNLIMNNPQLAELIDRNPELPHILNDPAAIHQTLETARNPELMREMLRNSDRAMSNIESSPEGFNTLRRIYRTVQEPFMNATTLAGATGNVGTDPFAALLGSQGGNQVRDRSTNQSSPAPGTTDSPAPNTNPLPNHWSSSAGGGAQTNTTRSDPSADSRPQAPAGLGGLGLPLFEGLFGAMQDTNLLNQLMQNPVISRTMQNLLSNPQFMNQALALSPQLQSLVGSSQLREVMQNAQSLRELISPEMMQQLSTLQQSILSQLSRPQSTQVPAHTGGGAGTLNNMALEALKTMLAGLGAGSLVVPNGSDVPPEELYANQLLQLHEMGFVDYRENVHALIATSGNVHAAVERILGNHGQ